MISSSYGQECLCGQSFDNAGAFMRHKRTCLNSKKRLANALHHAKELYHHKRCHVECSEESPSSLQVGNSMAVSLTTVDEPLHDVGPSDSLPSTMQPAQTKIPNEAHISDAKSNKVCMPFFFVSSDLTPLELPGAVQAEDTLPLSVHRTRWANRQLPKRFRDILPEPPLPLPPQDAEVLLQVDTLETNLGPPSSTTTSMPLGSQLSSQADPQSAWLPSARCGVLATQKNSFGLFHLYDGDSLPISNDPEDQSGDCQPTTYRCEETLPTSLNPFHPYPNESSWCIGDWYWNEGTQKSKQSFKSLVGIITSADFQSEDLHHTNWVAIDCQLGSLGPILEPPQITSNTEEWQAEDGGWMRRSITISVPFPQHFLHPGPKNYTISNFYHWSLLSIIRETLSDPACCRSFHFKPYSL